MSSPASLPIEIHRAAKRGEIQKVIKWLRKEGPIDALCKAPSEGGQLATFTLMHAASGRGQLEMVTELLKRGASVNLQTSLGGTALMGAAYSGHLPIVLVLLQHEASPDLQSNNGYTALVHAVTEGRETCVKALLQAKANPDLQTITGSSALVLAEAKDHKAIATLIRQHSASPQPAAAAPAAPPDVVEPVASSPTSLPVEILRAAEGGDLLKVV